LTYGAENERFQAAFAELKSLVGDDPRRLEDGWKSNAKVAELCDQISSFVRIFEAVEEASPQAFVPNVAGSAVRARRDFDDRWSDAVNSVANRELRALLDSLVIDLGITDEPETTVPHRPADPIGDKIAEWKDDAADDASAIETMADYVFDRGEDLSWAEASLEAWDKLKAIGLDVKGAFWRRRAVPFILIPPHVSRHYGKERASLYRRLHQAGKAFIFGAPLAALSLQRAVMEEVLTRHWGAEKGLIRDAGLPELPWGISADKLKRMAGDALHGDPEKYSAAELDRLIVKNFQFLRVLIENAPEDLETHKRQKT
jgi:hypothetical protein